MKKMMMAGLALIAVMTSCSGAMTTTYNATLLGANEVPPVATSSNTIATATALLEIHFEFLLDSLLWKEYL